MVAEIDAKQATTAAVAAKLTQEQEQQKKDAQAKAAQEAGRQGAT